MSVYIATFSFVSFISEILKNLPNTELAIGTNRVLIKFRNILTSIQENESFLYRKVSIYVRENITISDQSKVDTNKLYLAKII